MSRIAYVNIPAHGHVNPTLPIVQELVQRGDQVIYYNAVEFRPQIERTGARFRTYPPTELTSTTLSRVIQQGSLAAVSSLSK